MAHTFIGHPPTPNHTVHHKDGNCLNDDLSNLCWATKVEQGRNMKSNRAICKFDLQWKLLQTYGTVAEAADNNKMSWGHVKYAAETGSTATGFSWKFGVPLERE